MRKLIGKSGWALFAFALMTVGCSHDSSMYEAPGAAAQYKTSFEKNIMDGQQIDNNHTWNTATTIKVNVNSESDTIVKVYTANPIGTNVAPLATLKVTAGINEVVVAKPADAPELYVSMFEGYKTQVHLVQDGEATFADKATSSINPSAAHARARAPKKAVSFPTAPDASLFATAVPVGAQDEDSYYATQSGNFFVKTSDTQINVWMGNANLYFDQGTYNINSVGLNANTNFYLLPGAVVNMNVAMQYKNVNFYIAEGATLNGNIVATSNFYNRGTINSPKLILNNAQNQWNDQGRGFLYNQGTVSCSSEYHIDDNCQTVNADTMDVAELIIDEDAHFLNQGGLNVNGNLGVKNDNSTFTNEGVVTAGNVNVEGSADFFNWNYVEIHGSTIVNSNTCTWHNDGTYRTQYYIYQAGSNDVINNCRLFVSEKFYIGLGDGPVSEHSFQVNGEGSVETKDFEFSGPGYILLGSKAIFKVTDTATMGITTDNLTYGIYGVGDDFAVFQAKNVVKNLEGNHHYVSYGGKLYVAADNHFANGHDGGGMETHAYIFYFDQAATVNGQNNAPVDPIPETRCCVGYNADVAGVVPELSRSIVEPIMYYYYAFEDLGNTDDIDFNDIVLRVSAPVENKCTVELCAAGGILKTNILYDGEVICEDAHATMGGTMLNTGYNGNEVDVNKFVEIAELNNVTDASNLPFAILVEDGGQSMMVEAAGLGEVPLMIKVAGIAEGPDAGKWFWAKERVMMNEAYSYFTTWASDRTLFTDWYKTPNSNKVVKY